MPAFLQYGDALSILDMLQEKFGNRDISPNIVSTIEVRIPLQAEQLKKGHPVTRKTILVDDETDAEFQERMAKKEELQKCGATTERAFVIRNVRHTKKIKDKASKFIDDLRQKVKLREYDTQGLLSPTTIAALIIDLLRYGSSHDECFFCDKAIASPSHFFYGLGYEGDDAINEILVSHQLSGFKKRHIADILKDIRANVSSKKEHQALWLLLDSYNRQTPSSPLSIELNSNDEIIGALQSADMLNHYYGAYIDTDEQISSIEDFPPLCPDFIGRFEKEVIQPLTTKKAEADRKESSLFAKIFF